VNKLIDLVTNKWKEDLVERVFTSEDAKIITQIPIQEHIQDFMAWHYDKRGIFSIKSAYRVAVDSAARESISGLTSSSSAGEEHGNLIGTRYGRYPSPKRCFTFYGVCLQTAYRCG
jgi:hypothetical protein